MALIDVFMYVSVCVIGELKLFLAMEDEFLKGVVALNLTGLVQSLSECDLISGFAGFTKYLNENDKFGAIECVHLFKKKNCLSSSISHLPLV